MAPLVLRGAAVFARGPGGAPRWRYFEIPHRHVHSKKMPVDLQIWEINVERRANQSNNTKQTVG